MNLFSHITINKGFLYLHPPPWRLQQTQLVTRPDPLYRPGYPDRRPSGEGSPSSQNAWGGVPAASDGLMWGHKRLDLLLHDGTGAIYTPGHCRIGLSPPPRPALPLPLPVWLTPAQVFPSTHPSCKHPHHVQETRTKTGIDTQMVNYPQAGNLSNQVLISISYYQPDWSYGGVTDGTCPPRFTCRNPSPQCDDVGREALGVTLGPEGGDPTMGLVP